MQFNKVEVMVGEKLLGKKDVEPEGSVTSEEDHVRWLSHPLLLRGDFRLLL
jgi:hypothetical protein